MDDNSPMPFGKYEGQKMANIPASYLIWVYENKKCWGLVKEYIKDNLEVLRQEANKT